MKTLFAIAALALSTSALADGTIQLSPGSSAVVAPGEYTTVSCANGGGGGVIYFRCTLVWTSTAGDPMPTLNGEGTTRAEAIETIKEACKGQPGYGNAGKCLNIAPSATCRIERI